MSESSSAGPPRSLKPASLPRLLSTFVGRRAEIAKLGGLISRARLLTLVGPPGCGKTRLALESAAANRARFPQGVAFVDLGSVASTAEVADVAASAVRLKAQSASCLAHNIGNSELLMVIDNAEHLIGSVCSFAEQLLAGCPNLQIVTTSREPLNVDGEVCWPVEPLQVPPVSIQDPDSLVAYDAIALFCVRVSEHQPDFGLTATNAATVAAICRRLNGIPLALELAAATVRSLGLAEIAASLSNSFHILAHGRRTAAPRHRTMRAAIEWSHDLLDRGERLLFRQLALFPATFDFAAVKAICANDDLPADTISGTLTRLIAKSLVRVLPLSVGGVRYDQLEVVRQYGRERLTAHEQYSLEERHARYYAHLADDLSIAGGDFERRVELITPEYSNLCLALDWAAQHDPALEAAMAEHLQWYWALRGMFREARVRFELALGRGGVDQPTAARLCVLAATASRRLADDEAMRRYLERASELADEVADPSLSVWIANAQGILASQRFDWPTAEASFRRIMELIERMPADTTESFARMHGWPPSRARCIVMTRNNLALTLLQLGRPVEALDHAEQAVDAASDLFERSIPLAELLDTCGQVLLKLGRLAEARARFIAALDQAVANTNDHMAIGPLLGLACTAASDGKYTSALMFTAAGRRAAESANTDWSKTLGYLLEPISNAEHASREALSQAAASLAWERGSNMDTSTALRFAQDTARSALLAPLSPREGSVARLVAQGMTDKEIARQLHISPRTVEVHLTRIRGKLGLRNRAEVAVWAVTEAADA